MSGAGVMVEWNGEQVDARYRFRAETIVQWLGITSGEMREGDLRALGDEAHRLRLPHYPTTDRADGKGAIAGKCSASHTYPHPQQQEGWFEIGN
jgi:hypothetical protein